MASGDAAAVQGFSPVLATDDFRLGYQRINDAADFAATRVRYFSATSDTAMNALAGMKRGDLCWRSDLQVEYQYRTSWKPWNSDFITFTTPGMDQLSYTSFTSKYRYASGQVIWAFQGTVSGTGGNNARLGTPVTPDTSVKPRGVTNFRNADGSFIMEVRPDWLSGALGYLYGTQFGPPRSYYLAGNYAIQNGWTHDFSLEYSPA